MAARSCYLYMRAGGDELPPPKEQQQKEQEQESAEAAVDAAPVQPEPTGAAEAPAEHYVAWGVHARRVTNASSYCCYTTTSTQSTVAEATSKAGGVEEEPPPQRAPEAKVSSAQSFYAMDELPPAYRMRQFAQLAVARSEPEPEPEPVQRAPDATAHVTRDELPPPAPPAELTKTPPLEQLPLPLPPAEQHAPLNSCYVMDVVAGSGSGRAAAPAGQWHERAVDENKARQRRRVHIAAGTTTRHWRNQLQQHDTAATAAGVELQ